MGYQARVEIEDSHHDTWIGRCRADRIELLEILRHAVELDVPRLLASTEDAPQIWRSVLPSGVEIARLLAPTSVHLRWSDSAVAPTGALPGAPIGALPGASIGASLGSPAVSSAGSGDVVLKMCPPPARTLGSGVSSLFSKSRARRAYLVAHRLRAYGIATPRPFAFLERSHFAYVSPSFSAFEMVHAPTLYDVRERLRAIGGFEDKRRIVDRVAAFVRALHERHVLHADLHSGNLLVSEDDVMVVDLESVRTFASYDRVVRKTLERLDRDFSEAGLLTLSDRMRFLRTYLLHQGASRVGRRQLWRDVEARARARRPRVAGSGREERV